MTKTLYSGAYSLDGIRSYKHLNQIILEIVKESKKDIRASEINSMIMSRYKTDKIRVNPLKIGKRLQTMSEIESEYRPEGIHYYRYVGNTNR